MTPKNLRRYEAQINPTYLEIAKHYNTAVIPARLYKPKDEAKVESAVQLVQREILGRFRNERFTSLYELNKFIGKVTDSINNKPFQKMPDSISSVFDEIDSPVLNKLPNTKYEFAYFKNSKVSIDYLIEIRSDKHYYSVPHGMVSKVIDLRISKDTGEIFYLNKRVA